MPLAVNRPTGLAEGQPLAFTLVDRGGRVSASDLKIEGEALPVADAPRAPARQLTGERSSGVAFMLARALQSRMSELARRLLREDTTR